MPVYEYKCKTCGKVFEYKQRITDDALTHCPSDVCDEKIKGNGEVHRIISRNVGLVFKGSGFYLTDYTNRNGNSPAPSSSVSKKTENKKSTDKKSD